MKKWILPFLLSRAGGIITPIIATAVAAMVTKVAAFDAGLASKMDPAAITGFISAALIAAVNYWTNNVQADGVKQIQAVVNAPVDGYAGPVTFTEVRRALPNS